MKDTEARVKCAKRMGIVGTAVRQGFAGEIQRMQKRSMEPVMQCNWRSMVYLKV